MRLDDELSFLDIFDAIPDVMGLQDTDRRIIRYNEAGYTYLNLNPENAIGRHCYELIGRDRPCEECATEGAVKNGEPTSIIKYIPENNTWLNIRAYPIKDQDGKVFRIVEHLRDITEFKRLQVKLENLNEDLEKQVEDRTTELQSMINELTSAKDNLIESEKLSALGRMVAGISHEVNTPLGVAVTSASFIQARLKELTKGGPEGCSHENMNDFISQMVEACELVNRNLSRASNLMKGFKRIAADQTSEQLRMIDPVSYLEDLANSLHHELKRTAVKLRIEADGALVLTTFPGALSQIVTNLIMNSLIHAYPDGGEGLITIRLNQRSGEGIEILYSDDGCGMHGETLKHIYEPFFSTRIGGEGIGLGMNIVYNLVMGKLGGQIHCDSQRGMGTRFNILVPDLAERRS